MDGQYTKKLALKS